MISAQRAVPTTVIRANDSFRRFKPEPSHEVRQADLHGQSLVQQAKRTREMLRSMDPETVKQLTEVRMGLPFFQALALAKQEGKIIAPNFVHDRILTETKDEKYLEQNYSVWTGTLAIYEAPDKPFGKEVVSYWKYNYDVEYSISFKVPKQFQGKTNCALVIEHPDFELINIGNNNYELRVDEQSVRLIQNFPKKDGWYIPHSETKIPHGKKVEQGPDSRYLWRIADSSFIGPLFREFIHFGGFGGWDIGAYYRFCVAFGVHMVPLTAMPSNSDR